MSKCIPLALGPLEAEAKAMDEATLFSRDVGVRDIIFELESMAAAGRVPHPSPTRLPVCRCRICVFFFFFLGFTPTRLDSRQRGSIHAELASIHVKPGWFYHNRAISADDRYGRNWPWIWPEKPKLSPQRHSDVFLAFFFLYFVNQGIVNCFFKNILIVKIYRKHK